MAPVSVQTWRLRSVATHCCSRSTHAIKTKFILSLYMD